MNLKTLFKRPLLPVPNSLIAALLLLALIGFADASYLTIEHFRNVIPPCTISGCETVLNSSFSTIFGVPISFVGVLYYLAILIGVFSYLEGKREKLLRFSLILTFLGFLASLWLFIVQAFILNSFCVYCLGSAFTSTILFTLAIVIFAKYSASDTLPS